MPDKTMDSLKQAFMKENKNKADDCPMAEQISAYAFGELGPEQSRKVKEHLASCRYCLDMYLDIRVAQEEADSLTGQKPHVLPGLQEAIDKGKKPSVSFFNQN